MATSTDQQSIVTIPLDTLYNMIPLKLQEHNYPTWKPLIVRVLKKFRVEDLVSGESVRPPRFLEENIVNPAYTKWEEEDNTVLMLIHGSMSASVKSHVAGHSTSAELWTHLEKRFGNSISTATYVLHLRLDLQNHRKGSNSMSTYINEKKQISDQLAECGSRMSDNELVAYTLLGLPAEYDIFCTCIRHRSPAVSFRELCDLLLTEEIVIQEQTRSLRNPNNNRFHGDSNSFDNRGSGFGRGLAPRCSSNFQPTCFSGAGKLICQICEKPGHGAAECIYRLNFSVQGRGLPKNFAAMLACADFCGYDPWFADSGY